MVVCRFFQQGRCKFGDKCRDEHPGRNASPSSRNQFAPLQSTSGRSSDSTGRGQGTGRATEYKLDKDTIAKDIGNERPMYILSAYGPGKDAPLQLFGGRPREQSFEELRSRHYELAAQGKQQEAIQEAQALANTAEQQMKTALNDLEGAIKYICDGENEHPNRIDICKAKAQFPKQTQTSTASQPAFGKPLSVPAFGQPAGPSAFGQPSNTLASGQPSAPSAFGKAAGPTFGQLSAPVSAFGKPPTPAFGQPSATTSTFGQTSTPAFGQTAALGRPTTSFGQPSTTLGQTSSQTPAFGQPSTQKPAFGQPSTQTSAFGQPSTQTPAFGQPSTQTPAFGHPSTQSSPFGQASPPEPFAGTSNMRTDNARPNSFGAPSQPSPFGQGLPSSGANPFGTPPLGGTASPFGQPTNKEAANPSSQARTLAPTPFGAPTAPSTIRAFGQPATSIPSPIGQRSTQEQPSPFGQPSTANPTPSAPTANAAVSRSSSVQLQGANLGQKDAQGKLKTWMGKEVRYMNDHPHYRESNNGEWQRIWFPDGPPTFTKTEDLPEADYDEATKEQYRFATEHGRFGGSGIPLMPPRKEWCCWNL